MVRRTLSVPSSRSRASSSLNPGSTGSQGFTDDTSMVLTRLTGYPRPYSLHDSLRPPGVLPEGRGDGQGSRCPSVSSVPDTDPNEWVFSFLYCRARKTTCPILLLSLLCPSRNVRSFSSLTYFSTYNPKLHTYQSSIFDWLRTVTVLQSPKTLTTGDYKDTRR